MMSFRQYLILFCFISCSVIVASSLSLKKLNGRNYGFHAGSHYKHEHRGEDGVVTGEYGFRTPNGCMNVVKYRATNTSYTVTGTEKRDCLKRKPIRRLPPTTTTTSLPPTTTTTLPPTTTTTTTTTTRPPTTTTPKKRKQSPPRANSLRNSGKSLLDQVHAPPDMKRPKILSPDDPEPTYSFGFDAPGHGHTQAGLPGGVKKGEYYFDSPDGWRRIVSYVANENGFFPKMRRVRIPTTTPTPPLGRDLLGDTELNDDAIGKQLLADELLSPVAAAGCPYFFYTNTKINYHWERCILNGTKVGEYGRLADDGFSHRVKYYADATGFHPRVTKIPLTGDQENTLASITQGAFIIPKIEEEKQETERRIQEWIAQNQQRIDEPL